MKNKFQKLIPMWIVLFGFFTLGLADLIWIYVISDRFDCRKLLPMKQLALTVITLGVYGIIWVYRVALDMYRADIIKGKGRVLLLTVLSVFFLRTISVLLLYNTLESSDSDNNTLAEVV